MKEVLVPRPSLAFGPQNVDRSASSWGPPRPGQCARQDRWLPNSLSHPGTACTCFRAMVIKSNLGVTAVVVALSLPAVSVAAV